MGGTSPTTGLSNIDYIDNRYQEINRIFQDDQENRDGQFRCSDGVRGITVVTPLRITLNLLIFQTF